MAKSYILFPVLWCFPGHFFLRRWFLHVLWRFPGLFPSSAAFSPGFTPKTRMFLHRHNIFSRNCGVLRDILFLQWRFLHVLWRFPGHFSFAAMVSPRFVAFFGTFSLLGGIFSRFDPQNKDVSPPPQHFLPELWRFSGYFLSAAAVSPRFVAIFRTFFLAR